MKQQKVVRTYPKEWTNPTKSLSDALNEGWIVVMANTFESGNGTKGTEYILEKTVS